MILAVDLGNTNVVMALMDAKYSIRAQLRFETNTQAHSCDFSERIDTLCASGACEVFDIQGAVVSSVVSVLTDPLCDAIRAHDIDTLITVGSALHLDLNLGIDTPSCLGADLIADAHAAYARFRDTCVVLDLGTATTASVIDAQGTYLGTIIAPGLAIAQEALSAKASALPTVRFEVPEKLIGTNTTDSMLSGSLYGHASMLDGFMLRIEEELNCTTHVVITGGFSSLVAPLCKQPCIVVENLIFEGLWDIYCLNTTS